MEQEITLNNVNWLNRKAVVEAYQWYGRLSEDERQEFIDNINREQTDHFSQMVVATIMFIRITQSNDYDLDVLVDLSERFVAKAIKEDW